ncbi:hypothetical protein [Actinomadura sp. WAC 06369]|uniref:hypothetical protein n=1 Tax=Actinomadura sp. WAC 06369 TaxID=2203193 RepID=UPI001315A2E3|nr:hypothetical protein [Actinomadura sp. WAC 06369]
MIGMLKRRRRPAPQRVPTEQPMCWQKVTAFATVGRFVLGLVRQVRDWWNGEGPGPYL